MKFKKHKDKIYLFSSSPGTPLMAVIKAPSKNGEIIFLPYRPFGEWNNEDVLKYINDKLNMKLEKLELAEKIDDIEFFGRLV